MSSSPVLVLVRSPGIWDAACTLPLGCRGAHLVKQTLLGYYLSVNLSALFCSSV